MTLFKSPSTELSLAACCAVVNLFLLVGANLAAEGSSNFHVYSQVGTNQTSNHPSFHLSGQQKNVQSYTKDIPVNIRVKPARYLHGKIYIATGVNLTARAEILDEKFKNATIEYQWSVKNVVKTTNASETQFIFDKPDPDNFLQVLVFHHPNDTGTSNKSLVIRDPINLAEPVGKFFLEHGQLLDIKLKFTGTGPFQYCREFCRIGERERDCPECVPDITTNSSEINIIKYLHSVGNYTFIFVVDNVASRVSKSYSVRITETIRFKTIPFVPIVSSILAVIVLLSGVVLHLKFSRDLTSETADFDFIRHDYNDEDLWEEEQSFLQRVKYLLFKADRDHDGSMSDSNLSGPTRTGIF